ncbi:hypothetical protein ACFV3E_40865 [Streptomyces sp. NPDC059718]
MPDSRLPSAPPAEPPRTSAPAALPRVIDQGENWVYLDFSGWSLAVEATTRMVRWHSPTSPPLSGLPCFTTEVGGPETYNHLTAYYQGEWQQPAYQPREAAQLKPGDVITLDGELHTVTVAEAGPRGKWHLFTDHPDYPGPYERDPHAMVPVHPAD